jgi:hypothetical protein
MKTLKNIKRGGAFALVILTSVFCILATFAKAASYITPDASYIDGSTNTFNVAGTNQLVSVVPALSTNSFNLSITPRAQANTNLWPAMPLFDPRVSQPFNLLTLSHQFSMMASNGATVVFRYAGWNGTYWVSNVVAVSYNTNSAFASGLNVNGYANTNLNGWTTLGLQTIENPGPVAMTNLQTHPSAHPGF